MTITRAEFMAVTNMLLNEKRKPWVMTMHPDTARQIDWYWNRPAMRKLYREAGYPFGRNQGAFKRWALLRGRYK